MKYHMRDMKALPRYRPHYMRPSLLYHVGRMWRALVPGLAVLGLVMVYGMVQRIDDWARGVEQLVQRYAPPAAAPAVQPPQPVQRCQHCHTPALPVVPR